jgi:hypothetical protein
MNDWQPIETAPKDGTTVIVYDPAYAQPVVPGAWDSEEEAEGGQTWRASDAEWDRLNPTHWMPLPAPPAPEYEPRTRRAWNQ